MLPTDQPRVRISYKNSDYLVPLDFIVRVHPGGQRLILPYVNQDITQAFMDAKHSDMAVQLLEQWMEGAPAGYPQIASSSSAAADLRLHGRGHEDRYAQWVWNALVFGIAGASIVAAVLSRL
ncbi:hypothetical protein LSCM1_01412 [Leishmania martiniquensis]|uniref:Cytochrome b5 heme-binding domain-containing protein n=1 Tax=Leishmania martiniquensis TaxID=1580590 RepID=A0A836GP44_9TRYP|nr:hypothetical protein LSCM1_01412 [Leishmania martiniquensis]